jgi:putative aldouronate transport system permease protein
MRYRRHEYQYHLMLIPAVVALFVFSIMPMAGVIIAFKRYLPAKGIWGSQWVGLKYFEYMFSLPDSYRIFRNTLIIATAKIILNLVVPIFFSILLNEIRNMTFKKTVQTIIYVPHFLSWVVLATPIITMLSFNGMINNLVSALGGERTLYLMSNRYFRKILITTDVWKEFGFGTIVYLATITGISPNLYEAADIDGASRIQKIWHVTIPALQSIVVLMAVRSLGSVLNAGFDQVYNLYSPAVYETGDIIDTYVYRTGLLQMNYSLSTAVGLLKSLLSMLLIGTSYVLADKFANYSIF